MDDKNELLVEESCEQRSRNDRKWIVASYLCLLAVLPGALCGIFIAAFVLSGPSSDATTKLTDKLAELQVPTVSVSDRGNLPSGVKCPPAAQANVSVRPGRPARRFRPTRGPPPQGACGSAGCRFAAQWLRSTLNLNLDPCTDFYGYVCGSFRGLSQLTHLKQETKLLNTKFLTDTRVPPSNQNAGQKAAGLYQTCMAFIQSDKTETSDLVTWMTSLDLNFHDEKKLAGIDPVGMIVRCSLDLGVPAILSVEMHDTLFIAGKRTMKISFSSTDDEWLKKRRALSDNVNKNDYAMLLNMYGVQRPHDANLAAKLLVYEKEVVNALQRTILPNAPGIFVGIRYFASYTKPYVTSDKWASYFSTYTSNTYGADDSVLVQQSVFNFITALFKSKSVGERGLQYLVAWSVYTQLVDYTVPRSLLRNNTPSDACYEHAGRAMRFALTSPYFQTVVSPPVVQAVKTMVLNIRNAYRHAFETSSWVAGQDRNISLRKLAGLTTHVGSPGQHLDAAYVEQLYKPFPDVPPNRLFPSWIKAVSLSAHHKWIDQTTYIYDETVVGAHYTPSMNSLVIPTALMQRPLYFHEALEVLNYAGIGAIIGHEFMHAFDVIGTRIDDMKRVRQWPTRTYLEEYTKRAICLRRSHRAVLRKRARREELNDMLDSENLGDLAGLRAAYTAYSGLPQNQRSVTLEGLDISAERLFFIGHCIKTCAQYSQLTAQYAPYRSRCIVPLMNMPEFSSAFGCTPEHPMNSKTKCTFW
ncbi:hypothetical protein HPB50_018841 [Hyalomma asiaticum]|uniref:Uncharacterized protein n=1 Tax=Hyalomma asiaticum TaxID=266040 RepID=A0ACB7SJG6_HYAAI|nr:hypothetical protein HPB50_018841 [Hyalomma asiaticum]